MSCSLTWTASTRGSPRAGRLCRGRPGRSHQVYTGVCLVKKGPEGEADTVVSFYDETDWHAFAGTLLVAVCCALLAGTIGTLIGYAVAKNRRSRWASYVNGVAFLPYLMPSIAVGAAFFILFSNEHINLFNTYTLLIIAGTIKYIPFASRSAQKVLV